MNLSNIIGTIYLKILLFVVGRALAAASQISSDVKEEVKRLPEGMVLLLQVLPVGPSMALTKENGVLRYLGKNTGDKKTTVVMNVKNMSAALLLFTFRESTAMATAHDRILVTGNIPDLMTIIRILNLVEVLLLPRFIAERAVKRYPLKKIKGRFRVYSRVLLGLG